MADVTHECIVNGIKIHFPYKPYPTQLSMMARILKGLESCQNSLLESPTGSGKTLALLCSCIAWQMYYLEKNSNGSEDYKDEKEEIKQNENISNCVIHEADLQKLAGRSLKHPSHSFELKSELSSEIEDRFLEDDFKEEVTTFRINSKPQTKGVIFDDRDDLSACTTSTRETSDLGKNIFSKIVKMKRPPRIYYGTRTHKQISQVVQQLRNSHYKSVPMSILSSRDFTCIHPTISRGSNKNEKCKELFDNTEGMTCVYFRNVSAIDTQITIKRKGLQDAWDIEDLVKIGKKLKACPYYTARALKDEADIIFCPYNYLINPVIRQSMDIVLKNQIVILDEAHNIEDAAREAASFSITQDDLQQAIDELSYLVERGSNKDSHEVLFQLCSNLLKWMSCQIRTFGTDHFNQESKVCPSIDIIGALQDFGKGTISFSSLVHHFNVVCTNSEKDISSPESLVPSLSSASLIILKGLHVVLGYMHKENMRFLNDYRIVIVKTMNISKRPEMNEKGWFKSKKSMLKHSWIYTLNFWCMNPAVAFLDFAHNARTIILTSGTLAPLASFFSELGVTFPIQMEANHVISKSQIWVGTVNHGPTKMPLEATFKNCETFEFQDEIGQLLLLICMTIPHGILCFFPSYNFLEKITKRLKETGIWQKIVKVKEVMVEPRSGDKKEFDEIIQKFYNVVIKTEQIDSECNGALFLAVYRGKVSEGLNFSDNNARAVIAIGIPFPNIKDIQVNLKRQYNNTHSTSQGLLNGSEWYEIQAFRAVNQALGRCIRHKQDWGALILVDARFAKNPKKYIKGLSKWIRDRVIHFYHFDEVLNSLTDFTKSKQNECSERPPVQSSKIISSSVFSQILDTPPIAFSSPITESSPDLSRGSSFLDNFQLGEKGSQLKSPSLDTRNAQIKGNKTYIKESTIDSNYSESELFDLSSSEKELTEVLNNNFIKSSNEISLSNRGVSQLPTTRINTPEFSPIFESHCSSPELRNVATIDSQLEIKKTSLESDLQNTSVAEEWEEFESSASLFDSISEILDNNIKTEVKYEDCTKGHKIVSAQPLFKTVSFSEKFSTNIKTLKKECSSPEISLSADKPLKTKRLNKNVKRHLVSKEAIRCKKSFMGETDFTQSENKQEPHHCLQHVTCAKCSAILINSISKIGIKLINGSSSTLQLFQKQIPASLSEDCLFHSPRILKADDYLVTQTEQITAGAISYLSDFNTLLNCYYSKEENCFFQLLQCSQCQSLIGLEAKSSSSIFVPGQIWFLQRAVSTCFPFSSQ